MKPKASLPRIATTSCAKHRHLFLLLLLASFPSNFTASKVGVAQHVPCQQGSKDTGNCSASPDQDFPKGRYDPVSHDDEKKEERPRNDEVIKNDEKLNSKGMACPLESRAFRELKATVPSAIRDRMRLLSKKVPTIESATEIAHSIEILKLFNESSPHLDRIREEVHKGAQMLRTAFDRISEHITDQKSVPSDASETS